VIDIDLLKRFEAGLDPTAVEQSAIPARVLGYGEISTVFQIDHDTTLAYKRMPLFADRAAAEQYQRHYREYCARLKEAGLLLPEDDTAIVELPDRPVVLYIAQRQLPPDRFGHRLIHTPSDEQFAALLERIVTRIECVWRFNREHAPVLALAIDGQISNWVWLQQDDQDRLYYIDTSTPLYRIDGKEQLDPELFLQSAPSFLRWIIRWLFLEDVMNRYYDPRQVYIDLAANLFKEQRPDLVPAAVEQINRLWSEHSDPLTIEAVDKYYREDKFIWALFLAFRRLDRWLKTRLLRQRYEFILPGKIKR
jgi:hypothetical protein